MKKALFYEVGLVLPVVIGFLLGLLVKNWWLSYVLSAGAGIISAKLICSRKDENLVPYIIGIGCFMTGFLVGTTAGNDIVISALFIAAAVLSYLFFKYERSLC